MSLTDEQEEKKTHTVTDVGFESQGGTVETLKRGFWTRTRGWIRTIGAEETGVERIPEEMRTNQPAWELCTMFIAANCNITTLATGYLGTTTYALGWWDSFLCILFFNAFSVLMPAMAATLGPKLGLRTMMIPRYCFGWWPAKVLAILNIINQIGWGIVSGITGGEVLYDVGGGGLPDSVSVLIVCVVAMVFGLFGYRVLHLYDRYSWPVMLVAFAIVAGFGAPHFINIPMGRGKTEAANVFSFGTVIIGYEVAWFPVAADYGVYMKESTSVKKTFWWPWLGLVSSQVLLEWLGAAIGTLSMSSDSLFTDAYNSGGVGGLLGAVFEGHGAGVRGFGKFIEVLLAFSTAAVITINIYSLGLSAQVISPKLLVIPRFVWSFIGGAILLACSIAGRNVLADVMTNFLSICAYWIVPFCTVMVLEHYIWRRGYNYDLTAWDNPSKLPFGIAASITFIVGTVLSLLCMSQVWWVGPIALGIGPAPYGTDISWVLALTVCTIMYIPLRAWERRRWNL
ncbi:Purine-cytosine permease [Pleurostoma richardsiae]|uniref:Purine-cytosine permease n=1 Tax=Pleurostoma richardsiae TaxID=41990 RepID=A0AA38RBX2_9PEZI|nr:Purine-cytosine permease [Pleurostoma richardsiae]